MAVANGRKDPATSGERPGTGSDDLAAVVAAHPLWYHTQNLGDGVVTPGWFDLRPVVNRLPWPDVAGKRCLDVGTYDGHLAFELERRGAREVVATDIADHGDWDWPPSIRDRGPEILRAMAGSDKTRGFHIARDALGSNVEHRLLSVYDLSPEAIGTFDIVTCGALMLHLRDPMAALQAIRSVCREAFLSAEQIRLSLTLMHPRRPAADVDAISDLFQWFVPNAAGHKRMVESAGFRIENVIRPYAVPFGPGHYPRRRSLRRLLSWAVRSVTLGGDGVPYSAVLARPR